MLGCEPSKHRQAMQNQTTLLQSVNDFAAHCKIEKNLTTKTISAYKTDLLQLNLFLNENHLPKEISLISKTELRSFLDSISHLKPKSIKRKVASIKALFNYLEFEDILFSNPMRKMRISFKEPKQIPKVMDMSEVTRIFRAAYTTRNAAKDIDAQLYIEAIRDIAVIELLFGTGARVSEIANLTSRTINLDSGLIKIDGKGNKERIIQICNTDSLALLRTYFGLFKPWIEDVGYFLINNRRSKISDQSIRALVKRLATNAGIQKPITPHIFRHSFATLLLENDVDIKYIQSLLGHSSIATTQIYTHVNKEKQRQILLTKHPRKEIGLL